MEIKKANTIDEVYNALLARPLRVEELDEFYCNTDAVRNEVSARFQLKLMLQRNAASGRNAHYLFVGYRGCGKSTELNKLQKELDGEYIILNYSVMQELDPQSIEYIELFIVTMQRLFRLADEKDLGIDDAFLRQIENWTQTKEINEIREKHFSADTEAGFNTKLGIPYLQEFFLKLKGAAKASKSFKETIRDTLEPRLADLIRLCNDLISQVRMALADMGYKDLVIIIEDLDKIPLPQAEKLFFSYANQLTQLKATVVYTFPVSLYHNNKFGAVRAYFTDVIELPMIKIALVDGTPYQAGIDVLKAIVDARVNPALFAQESVLLHFISKTGGVIRDLFAMLNDAATATLYAQKTAIDEEHFRFAYNQLKREYSNTIADYMDDKGAIRYRAQEFYDAMAALRSSRDRKPHNSEIMMLLRQNLCVLSYNGEGWCDVHPVMKDVLAEKGYEPETSAV
jgi:hypothetical protein